MTPIRLAIVGGGPKAAALCAKIACLRDLFRVPIEATVFERSTPGAHWSGGESGYTDGVQCLCTPAERDLGFPYSDAFGEPGKIAERMLAEYSWAAYLIRNDEYARWVGAGRHRPSHEAFAAYIADAIARSGAVVEIGEVFKLRRQDGAWTVFYDRDGNEEDLSEFDGVVITGSGPPRPAMGQDLGNRWVFNGQTFWTNRHGIRDHLARIDDEAVRFSAFIGVVTVEADGRLKIGPEKLKASAAKALTDQPAQALKRAERLGYWFADAGSTRTVFDTMGLTV